MNRPKPNKSILSCPCCEKALINIGSRVTRPQPAYRKYRKAYPYLFVGYYVWMVWYVTGQALSAGQLGISFGLFALSLVPFVFDYFLTRMIPLWRVTECPYCHFTESVRLGRAAVPED